MNSKLLIVSWGVHPWPTGSSVIVNNLASAFSKDEMVLFGEAYKGRSEDGWPDSYPRIYRSYPRERKMKRGKRIMRWMELWKVVKEIREVIQNENVDKLLCIFPNDFYLYAAYLASQKEGIPFYIWFHNTYLDNVSGYSKVMAKWLQPVVFKASKKIFVMSDGMKSFMDMKYPEFKFLVLRHGFRLPDDINPKPIDHTRQPRSFVFTGSLNSSCEDATVRLMKTVLEDPTNEIHIYSGNDPLDFKKHGIAGNNVIFHEFTPLEKLYYKLPEYDVMLLPHGFVGNRTDVEFKTIFPTRTIPLLISNRPILGHTPPNCFFTDFLKENDCAYVVESKDQNEIKKAIDTIAKDQQLVNRITMNARSTADLFRLESAVSIVKNEILSD